MKLLTFLKCHLLGSHNWTCAAKEGIRPTVYQLDDGEKGFWEYARMYCKDCGKIVN